MKRGIYSVHDIYLGESYHIGIEEANRSGHLWTVDDAKDGDFVYSTEHNLLWIYKDKEHYHAAINLNYANFVSFNSDIVIPSDISPATKEQRELLLKKINELGYEWNEKNKKLDKSNSDETNIVINQPINNVKLYNDGDWIADRDGRSFKILSTNNDSYNITCCETNDLEHPKYILYTIPFNKTYGWHIWSISDAKDGDILTVGNCIFIFKELEQDTGKIISYCYLNGSTFNEYDGTYDVINENNGIILPSSKRDKEILFLFMKKEGYNWDYSNKKLINTNSDNDSDDENCDEGCY